MLLHLGRCDSMVKIRGYSVVLGKIEHVLLAALHGLDSCAVIADGEEGTEGGGFKSRKRARRDGSDAGSAESSAAPAVKKKKTEEDSSDTSKFVKEKDVQKSLMGEKGYTIELKVLKRRYKGLHKSRPEIKKQVHAELVRHIGKLCIVEGKQLTLKPEHRH